MAETYRIAAVIFRLTSTKVELFTFRNLTVSRLYYKTQQQQQQQKQQQKKPKQMKTINFRSSKNFAHLLGKK